MTDWNSVREEYPIFKERIYLQTHSGGPVTTGLIQETNRLLTELGLWGGDICEQWDREVEATRAELAGYLGVSTEETAFITSTTMAMNIMAYTFPNDHRILTFKDDFPNSFLPWLHQGFEIDYVDSDEQGKIHLADVEAAITADTKILISSDVMYRTGFRQDLQKLGAICKERGILFIVDATQSFGVLPIDIQACGIDILMFHAYKWLSAGFGIGGMYVRKALLSSIRKPFIGFFNVKYPGYPANASDILINEDASAYELGKTPYLNILMFRFMLKRFSEMGTEAISARVKELGSYFVLKCKEHQLILVSDFAEEHRSGIFNIKAPGITKAELSAQHIIARAAHGVISLAISFYNNEADIDTFLNYLVSRKPSSVASK
ncbi:Selenocysteine lyase/Cysteine desulfurase [Pedobacter steynii]|uniref:Selenocysteine lyase/Cysteine desulfurase n=1 Tax=Pedobacter steynii TaxID=430522 RepID=A0A1H0FPA2_9SPHI|nr:aminotransferase class V-fold PLP-dependent enzyme [Pedobacter steynii]NQX42047.1 aminotransferase class V-fold PLP-dependent enzyme [Pedobacter steynii]SDN96361.1 Selenocysteine lyase/Cysteine desulfurase [Pedobacter steynii]